MSNYRIMVAVRRQAGPIFNSDKFATESYDGTTQQVAHDICSDIQAWIEENVNAAEEFEENDTD